MERNLTINVELTDDDCFGVIYPAFLDKIDPLDNGEVEVRTINAPFDMSKVICTT